MDQTINGVTAVSYDMEAFNSSSDQQKQNMTQPSRNLMNELDDLADKYLNGEVRNIKVQITTNLPQTTPGIQESNALRRDAIINYLVNQGVDRESLIRETPVYNNSTWDATITYDEKQ